MKQFLLIALVSLCLIPAAQAQDTAKPLENLKTLILAAQDGDLQAQWALAQVYQLGDIEIRDTAKAAEYYEMAAQQGYGPAALQLAMMYSTGSGVPQSKETSMIWMIQAADAGILEAQFIVGNAYDKGLDGVEKNWKKAVAYFSKACSQDNPEACYQAGAIIAENASNDKALPLIERAAQLGHLISQVELATYYQEPRPGVQDLAKSKFWFQKAADRGVSEAAKAIWMQYAVDHGVEPEKMAMLKYYNELADNNDPEGFYHLGWMYRNGIDIAPDFKLAETSLLQAAKLGHPDAQFKLAQIYFFGNPDQGIEEQPAKAMEWLRKAVAAKHPEATVFLAECYENGINVEADLGETLRLLKSVADKNDKAMAALGQIQLTQAQTAEELASAVATIKKAALAFNPTAQMSLALLYREGKSVEQSDAVAFSWMKRAAMQDLLPAQVAIATYCQQGIGTQADISEARAWWEEAASKGHIPSMLNLAASLITTTATSEETQRGLTWLMAAEKMGSKEAADLLDEAAKKVSKEDWAAAEQQAAKSLR